MSKSKIIVFVVVMVLLVGGIIGGSTFWVLRKDAQEKARLAQANQDSETLGASTGSDSVSLNSGQGSGSSSNGLSVSGGTGSAYNLGQLTPSNLGNSSSSGSNSNSQSGSGSSSNSNNAASAFDPTTFKQYDKYKDNKDALFADVEKGNGAELGNNMKAAVYYRGWLTDGTLFDQTKTDSKGQKQPFVFTEGAHQVIPGWEQTVLGMKVGGRRLVIVPPAVGYGAQGQGPIPPNAVLIFEVQLVGVQ